MKTTVGQLKQLIEGVLTEGRHSAQDAEGMAQEFYERFPGIVDNVDVASNGINVYLSHVTGEVEEYLRHLRDAGYFVKVKNSPDGTTIRVWT